MLKQLSVSQKILGAIVLLFAWSLFTEQVSADERTGTIAFLSDRDRDPLFPIDISVYLINTDGLNERPGLLSDRRLGPIIWSPDGKSIVFHVRVEFATHVFLMTPVLLHEDVEHLPRQPGPKGTFVVPDALQPEVKNITVQLGGQKYLSPKWSPDGKWLALTSTDGSPDGYD